MPPKRRSTRAPSSRARSRREVALLIETSNGYARGLLNGISLSRSSGAVTDCTVREMSEAGLMSIDARGLTVAHNAVFDCANNGILIWRSAPGDDGSIVTANRIERIAAKAPVKLVMGHDDPTRKDVENWTSQSDHKAFCDAKIPCLYFGVEDFAQHHKATDDYETMTHAFYVRAVETMVRAVEDFDANLDAIKRPGGVADAQPAKARGPKEPRRP